MAAKCKSPNALAHMASLPEHDICLHSDGAHVLLRGVKCVSRLINDLDHGTRESFSSKKSVSDIDELMQETVNYGSHIYCRC